MSASSRQMICSQSLLCPLPYISLYVLLTVEERDWVILSVSGTCWSPFELFAFLVKDLKFLSLRKLEQKMCSVHIVLFVCIFSGLSILHGKINWFFLMGDHLSHSRLYSDACSSLCRVGVYGLFPVQFGTNWCHPCSAQSCDFMEKAFSLTEHGYTHY